MNKYCTYENHTFFCKTIKYNNLTYFEKINSINKLIKTDLNLICEYTYCGHILLSLLEYENDNDSFELFKYLLDYLDINQIYLNKMYNSYLLNYWLYYHSFTNDTIIKCFKSKGAQLIDNYDSYLIKYKNLIEDIPEKKMIFLLDYEYTRNNFDYDINLIFLIFSFI